MNPLTFGYPNYFSGIPGNAGAGQNWLDSQYATDFGFQTAPVYNLPMDYNMGWQTGIAGPGGYGMGYGMGGYGYMGLSDAYRNFINMDYKDRIQYMHEMEELARQNRFDSTRSSQQYAALTDGQTGSIADACRSLQSVVIEGESDQIVKQFENIVAMLKATPIYDKLQEQGFHTDLALDRALRNCAYEQFRAATGQDLDAMIDDNCSSAAANAFKNGISFGNAQKFSKEEVIAKLHGYTTPNDVPTRKTIGKIGSVATAIGTGMAIGGIFGSLPGAVIGGVVGAVGGITSALC